MALQSEVQHSGGASRAPRRHTDVRAESAPRSVDLIPAPDPMPPALRHGCERGGPRPWRERRRRARRPQPPRGLPAGTAWSARRQGRRSRRTLAPFAPTRPPTAPVRRHPPGVPCTRSGADSPDGHAPGALPLAAQRARGGKSGGRPPGTKRATTPSGARPGGARAQWARVPRLAVSNPYRWVVGWLLGADASAAGGHQRRRCRRRCRATGRSRAGVPSGRGPERARFARAGDRSSACRADELRDRRAAR